MMQAPRDHGPYDPQEDVVLTIAKWVIIVCGSALVVRGLMHLGYYFGLDTTKQIFIVVFILALAVIFMLVIGLSWLLKQHIKAWDKN